MFCPTGVQEAAYTVVDHVLHDVAQLEECMHLRVVWRGESCNVIECNKMNVIGIHFSI